MAGTHGEDPAPLTEEQRRLHFLSRFSLGVTPELVRQVAEVGTSKWLEGQVQRPPAPGRDVAKRLVGFTSLGMTNREVVGEFVKPIPAGLSSEERRRLNRLRNVPARELRDSVLLYGIYSPGQVREAATDFLRNHFSVAVDKGRVRYFGTEYEREVIRARAFGSFRDILGASAKHPAMLEYLDNAVSRRPPTKAELKAIEMRVRLKTKSKEQGREASDIAAQRGLNENYARELLELHTLGADNYYTQDDVENVARALTGWTIEKDNKKPLGFDFLPDLHAGEDKRVLRKVVKRNREDPQAEGEEVLDLLAKHQGTAEYLALKLCRYFVSDHPPESMLKRIASAFRKKDGDLGAVYQAIESDKEFYAPEHYRSKFKRPFEFLVSALRATQTEVESCASLHKALVAMNESIYLCKDPTGYYDQAEAWLDPGAFAVRWKFAKDLMAGRIDGVKVPRTLYEDLDEFDPATWKDRLVARIVPMGIGSRTGRVLDGMLAEYSESVSLPRARSIAPLIIGVLLGSPEFQRQ